MRWTKLLLALTVAAAPAVVETTTPSAMARELAGVNMPERVELDGRQLFLNGMGLRRATFLNIEVYAAGLYVANPTHDPDTIIRSRTPRRMVLTFLRDVEHDKIATAISEGFRHSAGKNFDALRPQLDQLLQWLPNLKKGNVLTFSYVPRTGVEVSVNDRPRGTLTGEGFAQALWAVWLGDKPPDKDLKARLLGVH